MSGLINWFCREGRRLCEGRSSRLDRLVLTLEVLEPRHLLAADGLGMTGFLDVAWQPEASVQEGPVALPAVSGSDTLSPIQGISTERVAPELIYLDQIARELGEVADLEDGDSVWGDDAWYNDDWDSPELA